MQQYSEKLPRPHFARKWTGWGMDDVDLSQNSILVLGKMFKTEDCALQPYAEEGYLTIYKQFQAKDKPCILGLLVPNKVW